MGIERTQGIGNEKLIAGVKFCCPILRTSNNADEIIPEVAILIKKNNFFPEYLKRLVQRAEISFKQVDLTQAKENLIWGSLLEEYKNKKKHEHESESYYAANDKKFKTAFIESQVTVEKAKRLPFVLKKEFHNWRIEAERKMKESPEKLSPELRKAFADKRFYIITKQVGEFLDKIIIENYAYYNNRWAWMNQDQILEIQRRVKEELKKS